MNLEASIQVTQWFKAIWIMVFINQQQNTKLGNICWKVFIPPAEFRDVKNLWQEALKLLGMFVADQRLTVVSARP